MKNIFKFFLFLTLFLSASFPVFAAEAGSSAAVSSDSKDYRIPKLKAFLESYNSPLSDSASDLIKIADKYGIDWKLVPAISGVESTFGKFIPQNSYNAYGWNGGEYYFDSWKDSIEIVTRSLRKNYYNRGADSLEEISRIYCPPNSSWGTKVAFFMDKLENFAVKSTSGLELSL